MQNRDSKLGEMLFVLAAIAIAACWVALLGNLALVLAFEAPGATINPVLLVLAPAVTAIYLLCSRVFRPRQK